MSQKKKTIELDQILGKMNPDRIDEYLKENEESVFADDAFGEYMKDLFKKKGYTQQEVFIRADMPERYGYKIISGEKHTVQRDVILRLCLASRCDLEETNRALKLYGFSQLYSRIPRDALIITCFNTNADIDTVNENLQRNGFTELYSFVEV